MTVAHQPEAKVTPRKSLEAACRLILGNALADSIIESQGLHWAVVAAVADARVSDDPWALATLSDHLAAIRKRR